MALAASLPACLLVFYLVRLQGSLALFWLVHVVSIAVSTGAVRMHNHTSTHACSCSCTMQLLACPALHAGAHISPSQAAGPASACRAAPCAVLAALALLVGALSPSIDVAAAALPAYITSLLCK